MKKNRKISLIVIPIIIFGVLFLSSSLFQHFITPSTENNLDGILIDITDSDLPSSLPVVGSSNAPVTIMAFNDYQCKDCKTWYDNEYPTILKNLIESQKANMIFLDSISLGEDSILISEATFCAYEQKKYSEYQKIVFNSQQEIDSWANSEQLKKFAMELDLDMKLFDECLDSRKYEKKIHSNLDYTKNIGVEKIPLFKIVNFEGKEHIIKGGVTSDVFEIIVEQLQ